MTAVDTGLRIVIDVALGVWLGAMLFFSFVVAPRVFTVLEDRAGDVVRDLFPRYYNVGVGLGLVAFSAGVLLGLVGGFGFRLGLLFFFVAVPIAISAYARWVLLARMAGADEEDFSASHRRSVVMNGLAMVSVLAALVVSHLPA